MTLRVAAEAQNVEPGELSIQLDSRIEVLAGERRVSLPAGTYRQTIAWSVGARAHQPAGDTARGQAFFLVRAAAGALCRWPSSQSPWEADSLWW